MPNITNFSELKVGDILSETQYYKVVEIVEKSNGLKTEKLVKVVNDRGFSFYIGEAVVEEGIYTANQYSKEVQITRTELIQKFAHVGDTVFTVSFNKASGDERILIGYLVQVETGFGRSTVIDLQASKGSNPNHDGRLRQVDHRTLNWLIHKNVKHTVKSK